MPNAIKYTTGSETLALKKGNFYIGTGDVGKGPSSGTSYYNGVTPPSSGYTVYLNNNSLPGGLSYFTAGTDSSLISQTNTLFGTSYTSATECLVYYASQTDKMVLNRDYENIITDGLVFNMDAGFTPSYPRSGTTWYNVSGNNNGTLTNGPTYTTSNGGGVVFDGTNDYIKTSFSAVPVQGPGTISFFGYYSLVTGVLNAITLIKTIGGIQGLQIGIRSSGIVWIYGGSSLLNYTTPTLNQIAQWTLTFNGPSLQMYINGVLDSSTNSAGNQSGDSDTFYMGTYADSGLEAFPGTIYNCQIYNRVLSADEVLQNYNAQKSRFGL